MTYCGAPCFGVQAFHRTVFNSRGARDAPNAVLTKLEKTSSPGNLGCLGILESSTGENRCGTQSGQRTVVQEIFPSLLWSIQGGMWNINNGGHRFSGANNTFGAPDALSQNANSSSGTLLSSAQKRVRSQTPYTEKIVNLFSYGN